MLDVENRKKWLSENTGKITVNAKKAKIDTIKQVASDNGITPSKFMLACTLYAIENGINFDDISAYL